MKKILVKYESGWFEDELIQCKDCKYWWKENELCTHEKTCDGNVCCLECDSEFYCGYAERKES